MVAGSRDWKVQVRTPVVEFREALILTMRFMIGRRSTVVVKGATGSGMEGGVITLLGKVIGLNARVVRSTLVLSVSVIVTAWAGAEAVGWFSK